MVKDCSSWYVFLRACVSLGIKRRKSVNNYIIAYSQVRQSRPWTTVRGKKIAPMLLPVWRKRRVNGRLDCVCDEGDNSTVC